MAEGDGAAPGLKAVPAINDVGLEDLEKGLIEKELDAKAKEEEQKKIE